MTNNIINMLVPIVSYCLMALVVILPIALFFGFRAIISVQMKKIAVMKGHEKSHAFALCFWLGIPGYIYVVALPDLVQRKQLETIINVVNAKKLENF